MRVGVSSASQRRAWSDGKGGGACQSSAYCRAGGGRARVHTRPAAQEEEEEEQQEEGRRAHLRDDLAGQRVAVRVEARRPQADEHVAGALRVERREDAPALHGADGEAREVVVAPVVHGRHLGRLAADERTAGLAAALGDAAHDGGGRGDVEVSAGVVVEEEQRLGALSRRGGGGGRGG